MTPKVFGPEAICTAKRLFWSFLLGGKPTRENWKLKRDGLIEGTRIGHFGCHFGPWVKGNEAIVCLFGVIFMHFNLVRYSTSSCPQALHTLQKRE